MTAPSADHVNPYASPQAAGRPPPRGHRSSRAALLAMRFFVAAPLGIFSGFLGAVGLAVPVLVSADPIDMAWGLLACLLLLLLAVAGSVGTWAWWSGRWRLGLATIGAMLALAAVVVALA